MFGTQEKKMTIGKQQEDTFEKCFGHPMLTHTHC